MNQIIELDGNILLWIQEHLRADFMTGFWKAVTFLGDGGWFWIVLGIVLVCIPKTRKTGVTALVSLAIGALLTNVLLKNLVARTRPFDAINTLVPLIAKPRDFSFPSGHTCASFSSALIYYRMLPKKYGVAAIVLATLIACSRLYLGVHYPTDIIGGFLVAWAASKSACAVTKKWRKMDLEESVND